jgi:hypothetical protein
MGTILGTSAVPQTKNVPIMLIGSLICIGGVWKPISEVYICIGGAWQTVSEADICLTLAWKMVL